MLATVLAAAAAAGVAAAIDIPSPPFSPDYPGFCLDRTTTNEPCPGSGYFLLGDLACVNNGFGGCPGSAHRFDTLEECEQTCVGLSLPVCEQPIIKGMLPSPTKGHHTVMHRVPATQRITVLLHRAGRQRAGLGKASIPRWGVNFFTGECEFFIFGGGNSNDNNFETEAACRKACPPPTGPAPVRPPSRPRTLLRMPLACAACMCRMHVTRAPTHGVIHSHVAHAC